MKLKLFLYGLIVQPIYWFRLFLEVFVKDSNPKVIRVKDVNKYNFSKAKFINGTIRVEVGTLMDAIKFNMRFLDYVLAEGAISRYGNGLMDTKEKKRCFIEKVCLKNIKEG